MIDEKVIIRDFIYLDWERIRSISSQLLQGIPDEMKIESSDQKEIHASGSIGLNTLLPFIPINAEAGGDFRFYQTKSETRSLHHHIYSLVEKQLLENEIIQNIDANFSENRWKEGDFFDGQYALISGLIRFSDYEYISHWLESYGEYFQTIMNIDLQQLKQNSPEFNEKRKEINNTLKYIKNYQLDKLSKLIRELFGDIIQIKIVPNISHSNHILTGSCIKDFFYDIPHVLWQKFGYEVDADWVVFCQINQPCSLDISKKFLPIGNQINDNLEAILLSLDELQKKATKVNFPTVSITPLAIYRTCENHLSNTIKK